MTDGFDNKFIHFWIRLKLDQMKNTTHRELLRLKQKWNPLLLQILNLSFTEQIASRIQNSVHLAHFRILFHLIGTLVSRALYCSCRVPHIDSIELWDEKPQRRNKWHVFGLHSQICHDSFTFLKNFLKGNVF